MAYTLRQIESIVKSIAEDHPQVKACIDIAILGDEGHKDLPTPYIAYDVLGVLVNGRASYEFYIACMTNREEDNSDIREGQGDTAQILVDFISSMEAADILDQDTDILLSPAEDNQNQRIGYTMTEYLHSERQQCNEGQ